MWLEKQVVTHRAVVHSVPEALREQANVVVVSEDNPDKSPNGALGEDTKRTTQEQGAENRKEILKGKEPFVVKGGMRKGLNKVNSWARHMSFRASSNVKRMGAKLKGMVKRSDKGKEIGTGKDSGARKSNEDNKEKVKELNLTMQITSQADVVEESIRRIEEKYSSAKTQKGKKKKDDVFVELETDQAKHGKFTLMVDSGADTSFLRAEAVKEDEISSVEEKKWLVGAFGGRSRTLESIQVIPKGAGNLQLEMHVVQPGSQLPADGVLGRDTIWDRTITDSIRKKLIFEEDEVRIAALPLVDAAGARKICVANELFLKPRHSGMNFEKVDINMKECPEPYETMWYGGFRGCSFRIRCQI